MAKWSNCGGCMVGKGKKYSSTAALPKDCYRKVKNKDKPGSLEGRLCWSSLDKFFKIAFGRYT